jgi:hypothetical protein
LQDVIEILRFALDDNGEDDEKGGI